MSMKKQQDICSSYEWNTFKTILRTLFLNAGRNLSPRDLVSKTYEINKKCKLSEHYLESLLEKFINNYELLRNYLTISHVRYNKVYRLSEKISDHGISRKTFIKMLESGVNDIIQYSPSKQYTSIQQLLYIILNNSPEWTSIEQTCLFIQIKMHPSILRSAFIKKHKPVYPYFNFHIFFECNVINGTCVDLVRLQDMVGLKQKLFTEKNLYLLSEPDFDVITFCKDKQIDIIKLIEQKVNNIESIKKLRKSIKLVAFESLLALYHEAQNSGYFQENKNLEELLNNLIEYLKIIQAKKDNEEKIKSKQKIENTKQKINNIDADADVIDINDLSPIDNKDEKDVLSNKNEDIKKENISSIEENENLVEEIPNEDIKKENISSIEENENLVEEIPNEINEKEPTEEKEKESKGTISIQKQKEQFVINITIKQVNIFMGKKGDK